MSVCFSLTGGHSLRSLPCADASHQLGRAVTLAGCARGGAIANAGLMVRIHQMEEARSPDFYSAPPRANCGEYLAATHVLNSAGKLGRRRPRHGLLLPSVIISISPHNLKLQIIRHGNLFVASVVKNQMKSWFFASFADRGSDDTASQILCFRNIIIFPMIFILVLDVTRVSNAEVSIFRLDHFNQINCNRSSIIIPKSKKLLPVLVNAAVVKDWIKIARHCARLFLQYFVAFLRSFQRLSKVNQCCKSRNGCDPATQRTNPCAHALGACFAVRQRDDGTTDGCQNGSYNGNQNTRSDQKSDDGCQGLSIFTYPFQQAVFSKSHNLSCSADPMISHASRALGRAGT